MKDQQDSNPVVPRPAPLQDGMPPANLQPPIEVVEDESTGDKFLIYSTAQGVVVELQVEGPTFWTTQRQMATAFGVTHQNISLHLQNIFRDNELDEESVCKESLRTATDGKRYLTKFYNLDALISVGYRIGGRSGTAFRLWATDKLFQYLTKGFVIDAKRLKNTGEQDRVSELREIIRDIRSSEANVYAELRRICSLCQDYDPSSQAAREFYTRMQAKLFWATLSQTPSMVLLERANANLPNMGVQTFAKQDVLKNDTTTAKNYLMPAELKELNRLTSILLDILDDQMEIGRLTMMHEASALLDKQLANLNRPVLRHGGTVSHDTAERHAHNEYKRFDADRRRRRAEETEKELAELKVLQKKLPKAVRRSRGGSI